MITGTLILSSSDQYVAGVPQNHAGVYSNKLDQYFVFYQENNYFKCKHGSNLNSLSDTVIYPTGNAWELRNNGRAYSLTYGYYSGTPYCWGHLALEQDDMGWVWTEHELTSTGLQFHNSVDTLVGDSQRTLISIDTNYSGDVTELYGASQIWNGFASTRYIEPGFTVESGLGTIDGSNILFPEHTHVFKLEDKYIGFISDEGTTAEIDGNFGHASEFIRDDVIGTWGSEQVLDGIVGGSTSASGDFVDQNYSSNESHAGQQDIVQSRDGRLFFAYVSNIDRDNGDYGYLRLLYHGSNSSDGWTLLNKDVAGGYVKQVCLSIVNNLLYILYVRYGNERIYGRIYNTSTGDLSEVTLVSEIRAGFVFKRMSVTANNKLGNPLLVWSEYDGVGSYDLMAKHLQLVPNVEDSLVVHMPLNDYNSDLLINDLKRDYLFGEETHFISGVKSVDTYGDIPAGSASRYNDNLDFPSTQYTQITANNTYLIHLSSTTNSRQGLGFTINGVSGDLPYRVDCRIKRNVSGDIGPKLSFGASEFGEWPTSINSGNDLPVNEWKVLSLQSNSKTGSNLHAHVYTESSGLDSEVEIDYIRCYPMSLLNSGVTTAAQSAVGPNEIITRGIDFNGTSYIDSCNTVNLSDGFSMISWVYFKNYVRNYTFLGSEEDENFAFKLRDNTRLCFDVGGTTSGINSLNSLSDSLIATTGVWHQVGITYDGGLSGLMTCYLDGILAVSQYMSGISSLSSFTPILGAKKINSSGRTEVLDGMMSDFRLYDRHLSSGEVYQKYSVGVNNNRNSVYKLVGNSLITVNGSTLVRKQYGQ